MGALRWDPAAVFLHLGSWGSWTHSQGPEPALTDALPTLFLPLQCLRRGLPPEPQNLFMKNCVFVLTSLNFSHLQSALRLMRYTYRDASSTAQNSFEPVRSDAL